MTIRCDRMIVDRVGVLFAEVYIIVARRKRQVIVRFGRFHDRLPRGRRGRCQQYQYPHAIPSPSYAGSPSAARRSARKVRAASRKCRAAHEYVMTTIVRME
jgi:hypothetical protein